MIVNNLQGHLSIASFYKCALQLCNRWQDVKWHRASRGPSATAEPLIHVSFRAAH